MVGARPHPRTHPAHPEGTKLSNVISHVLDLDPTQVRLLDILTTPDNDPYGRELSREQTMDLYDDFGGANGDNLTAEVEAVGTRLFMHYAIQGPRRREAELVFALTGSSQGDIFGYAIGIRLRDTRLELVDTHDLKNATDDPQATGLRAAIAIAERLEGDYRQVVQKATKLGLIAR